MISQFDRIRLLFQHIDRAGLDAGSLPNVREHAACFCQEDIPLLLEVMQSVEDPRHAETLLAIVSELGSLAEFQEVLVGFLADGRHPHLAIDALSRIRTDDSLNALASQLSGDLLQPSLKARIAVQLAANDRVEARQWIEVALHAETSPRLVLAYRQALARLGDATAGDAIVATMRAEILRGKEGDWSLIVPSVRAIGFARDSKMMASLLALLEDSHSSMPEEYVRSLCSHLQGVAEELGGMDLSHSLALVGDDHQKLMALIRWWRGDRDPQ